MNPSEFAPAPTPGVKTLFIVGTDTNVGKTQITCLIARQLAARGLKVGAYKPVCSGAILSPASPEKRVSIWDDIHRLQLATGGEWSEEVICPQRFLAPLAPPVAARLEGRSVDFDVAVDGAYRFPRVEILLVEGAGGWLSPVTETAAVADLACSWNVPILIVARAGLGTINHSLLTIESIRSRGLRIAGVVLNESTPADRDQSSQTNGEEIAKRSGVPVLGIVPHGSETELLRQGKRATIDWVTLASPLKDRVTIVNSPSSGIVEVRS